MVKDMEIINAQQFNEYMKEDAVLVDSSEMDIDEVVEAIRSIYEEKKGC